MPAHTLIWKQTPERPIGADGLMSWASYSLTANPHFFRHVSDAQVGQLSASAVADAVQRGEDVTIAWGTADLWATPAAELEKVFLRLQPRTIVCPERPPGARQPARWIVHTVGEPASITATAVHRAVLDHVAAAYPEWRHAREWSGAAFLLRHGVTGRDLGLVPPPPPPTPDDIVASIADDSAVCEANRRADPDIPSTMADLVRTRLEAQARAGIAPENQAPVYSSETDSILLPVVMLMGRGDGPRYLPLLRKEMRRRYGDQGDAVLSYALRTCRHDGPGIEALRAAAKEAEATAA
jgi:hypothetical protein